MGIVVQGCFIADGCGDIFWLVLVFAVFVGFLYFLDIFICTYGLTYRLVCRLVYILNSRDQ